MRFSTYPFCISAFAPQSSPRLLPPRIWQSRHNLSAYDAAYVALSEEIGAVLLTREGCLTSASGTRGRNPGTVMDDCLNSDRSVGQDTAHSS
jgi:hypothetical protein